MKVRKVPLRRFEYSGTLSDVDEANKLAAEFRTTVLTDRDLHERVSAVRAYEGGVELTRDRRERRRSSRSRGLTRSTRRRTSSASRISTSSSSPSRSDCSSCPRCPRSRARRTSGRTLPSTCVPSFSSSRGSESDPFRPQWEEYAYADKVREKQRRSENAAIKASREARLGAKRPLEGTLVVEGEVVVPAKKKVDRKSVV